MTPARVFGDLNEEATAALELANLRQGNNNFARYYADFSRLTAILEYGDKARRYALERGLSPELLDGISGQANPPGRLNTLRAATASPAPTAAVSGDGDA